MPTTRRRVGGRVFLQVRDWGSNLQRAVQGGHAQLGKASIGSGASGDGCPLELQVAVRHQCDLQTAVVGL